MSREGTMNINYMLSSIGNYFMVFLDGIMFGCCCCFISLIVFFGGGKQQAVLKTTLGPHAQAEFLAGVGGWKRTIQYTGIKRRSGECKASAFPLFYLFPCMILNFFMFLVLFYVF